MRVRGAILVLLAVALGAPVPAGAALELTAVRHEPQAFDAAAGQGTSVRFRLSEPARVALHLYDGRDLRIRSVASGGVLPAGEHRLTWDGKDARGRAVPPEAYVYTLEATAASGSRVVWDPADTSGGEMLAFPQPSVDRAAKALVYELPKTARVRIRIGLGNGGPLLLTLIDWVPRSAGPQRERWDGRDATGVLDLLAHPGLAFQAEAFALPENTLLVLPAPDRVRLIAGLPAPVMKRDARPPAGKRMYDYPHQPIESRGDFPVRLELPGGLAKTKEGLPIVRGPLPVRLTVDDRDLAAVLNQRCEAAFFVDGGHAFESEVAFLPITWTWTPRPGDAGARTITANLRGYEGRFGMTTIRVFVAEDGQ